MFLIKHILKKYEINIIKRNILNLIITYYYNKNFVCLYNSEENEESEDKKIDWKDIKKETEDVQNVETEEAREKSQDDGQQKSDKPATEEITARETNTIDKDSKMTGKKSEARHAESRYAEVPMSHMFCHICNKHMWDGYVCT